jgi:hypothetical protein
MKGSGRFGSDAKQRLAARQISLKREKNKASREKAFSNPKTPTETLIKSYNEKLDQNTKQIDPSKWDDTGIVGNLFKTMVVPNANALLSLQNVLGKADENNVPANILSNPLVNTLSPEEEMDLQDKIAFGMAAGSTSNLGGKVTSRGKEPLSRIIARLGDDWDLTDLRNKGYDIARPSLDQLKEITIGSRVHDPNLPALRTLDKYVDKPTILAEGELLLPDAKGSVVKIAGDVNKTVTQGYTRMIKQIQNRVKKDTGTYLTTHEIEQLTGLNPSQMELFGENLDKASAGLANDMLGAAQGTWPGMRSGVRILGRKAQSFFDASIFDMATGFMNRGHQNDHLRSPTDAGDFIADKFVTPAIKKGEDKISSYGEDLIKEVNRRTQNVEQVQLAPEIVNLGKGAFDLPILGDQSVVTRRLGDDVLGLLDPNSPAYAYHQDALRKIWLNNPLKEYETFMRSPEQIKRQTERVGNKLRGIFGDD